MCTPRSPMVPTDLALYSYYYSVSGSTSSRNGNQQSSRTVTARPWITLTKSLFSHGHIYVARSSPTWSQPRPSSRPAADKHDRNLCVIVRPRICYFVFLYHFI